MIEKCRYFNNHQTACSLMLDDLSNAATTLDGTIQPWNDWGYGRREKESLYRYLEDTLFAKHPEIRGTIFLPTSNHATQYQNSGYNIKAEPVDEDFAEFVREISDRFDIAFHGTVHGRYINSQNPELAGNWEHEFEYVTEDDIPYLKSEITRIEKLLGIRITGGKYPGLVKNSVADTIIEQLGFKWWTLNRAVAHTKSEENLPSLGSPADNLVIIPMNVYGNCFSSTTKVGGYPKQLLRAIKREAKRITTESFIGYLYDSGAPITIQEHFQNQRTDGRRQIPNIFDDMPSVEHIYSILRGADIWHTDCSALAHYFESYRNSRVTESDGRRFELEYSGNWDRPFISLKASIRRFRNRSTGEIVGGIYRNGHWIYNSIGAGTYEPAESTKAKLVSRM